MDPSYNYVGTDAYLSVQLAVTRCLQMGYRRIGFVCDQYEDFEASLKYSSGFLSTFRGFGLPVEIPPLRYATENPSTVQPWLKEHKPDVVLGMNDDVPEIMQQTGLRIPEDVGWVHVDWAPGMNHWTAIDSRHRDIGILAVDLAIAQFQRNDFGVPGLRRNIFVEGSWIQGETTRTVGPSAIGNRKSFFIGM
jgi:DNA-binding LacI/PurR family transcriptional regulator